MPTLSELMSVEDNRTAVAVKRAIDQIGHALGEHGLYVTVDVDGNFGVDRLPPRLPRKDEPISQWLRRMVEDGTRRERPVNGFRLDDKEAKQLAADLAGLQLDNAMTEAKIYESIVAGNLRFMDVPIIHYWG